MRYPYMPYLKYITLTLFLTASTLHLSWAQGENTYSRTESSDPAAVELLNKMEEKLKNYPAIDLVFTLRYEIPGEENQQFEGTVFQQEDAYILDFPGYLIMSDGDTRWVYQDEIKELQIYNVDHGEGHFNTPMDYIKMATGGDYVFALAGQSKQDGKTFTAVEFKPLDTASEYSKMRLLINSDSPLPAELILFGRDATRIYISMKGFNSAGKKLIEEFRFPVKKYKDIHIEDLRLE